MEIKTVPNNLPLMSYGDFHSELPPASRKSAIWIAPKQSKDAHFLAVHVCSSSINVPISTSLWSGCCHVLFAYMQAVARLCPLRWLSEDSPGSAQLQSRQLKSF